GPVAPARLDNLHAVSREMRADCRLIEGHDLQRKMIDIAPLLSRPRAAPAPECAIERDEIDQRSSSPQLDESDRLLPVVDAAAQHIAIEGQAPLQIDDTEHHMIDGAKGERWHAPYLILRARFVRRCPSQTPADRRSSAPCACR